MVVLFIFPKTEGLPVVSPFLLQVGVSDGKQGVDRRATSFYPVLFELF